MAVYVIKAMWRGTAKLIKIEAPNEVKALEKAWRSRHVKGKQCLEIILIRKQ